MPPSINSLHCYCLRNGTWYTTGASLQDAPSSQLMQSAHTVALNYLCDLPILSFSGLKKGLSQPCGLSSHGHLPAFLYHQQQCMQSPTPRLNTCSEGIPSPPHSLHVGFAPPQPSVILHAIRATKDCIQGGIREIELPDLCMLKSLYWWIKIMQLLA